MGKSPGFEIAFFFEKDQWQKQQQNTNKKLAMKDEIYSKGLYSTWVFQQDSGCLFDCGEGVASHLGNRSGAVDNIFITHGHTDHIAGLPTLLHARTTGMTTREKPLRIHYPKGCRLVESLIKYCQSSHHYNFPLEFREIEPEQEIPTNAGGKISPWKVEAFQVIHGGAAAGLTLGYKISEARTRLKAEFRHLFPPEIQSLVKKGEEVQETYKKVLWAYSGDSASTPIKAITGASVLWHDSTFLNRKDRNTPEKGKNQSHATADEALNTAIEAKVKTLGLLHISPRYTSSDIRTAIAQLEHKSKKQNGPTIIYSHPGKTLTWETKNGVPISEPKKHNAKPNPQAHCPN